MSQGATLTTRQWQRQRFDNLPRQCVLKLKHVAERDLCRVGPKDGTGWCLEELRADTQRVPGPEQRAAQHDVHLGLVGNHSQIGCIRRETGGGKRRANDERFEGRQRVRDGIGQTERQEVDLGVRLQQPERQHHEARDWPCCGRPVTAWQRAPPGDPGHRRRMAYRSADDFASAR